MRRPGRAVGNPKADNLKNQGAVQYAEKQRRDTARFCY